MIDIKTLGIEIAKHRKRLKLSQTVLAQKSGTSRATLDSLEHGRSRELGFSKINRILTVLGLELKLQLAGSHRPTLDDLLQEGHD